MHRTVTFGETGVSAPRIFTGGWRVETRYFGEVDREGMIGAFAHSFELGLPHNTAIEYGNGSGEPGRAERWAGEAARRVRDRQPVIFTKYGVHMPLLHNGRSTPGCHPDSILEDFGGSRERLGFAPTGWILHHYDKQTPVQEILRAINRLHADGRAKVFGISHGFERVEGDWRASYDYWRLHGPFQVIEQGYNMASGASPLEQPQIAYGLEHGIVVTVYSVLGTGMLAPRVLDGRLPREDVKYARFFEADGEPKPALKNARALREALLPRFESLGLGWIAGVISLAASMHPLIVPIIGVRTREHVDDVQHALDHLLSADQVGEIAETLKGKGLLPGLTEFLDQTEQARTHPA